MPQERSLRQLLVAPPVTLARLVRSLNRRKIPAQIVHLENGKMEPGRSTAKVVPRAGPLELKDKLQTAPNVQPANIKMEKESKLAKTVQPESDTVCVYKLLMAALHMSLWLKPLHLAWLTHTVLCDRAHAGTGRQSGCASCANGKKTSTASSGATGCVHCSTGQVPTSNKASCEWCPVGKYKGNGHPTRIANCNNCQSGKYRQKTTAVNACEQCAAGEYLPNNDRTKTCRYCENGKFSSVGATNSCTQCAAGKQMTGTAASGSCQNCPNGKYIAAAGTAGCTPVPVGRYRADLTETGRCTAGNR